MNHLGQQSIPKKYVWSLTEKLCAFYVPIYEVFVENVSQRKT